MKGDEGLYYFLCTPRFGGLYAVNTHLKLEKESVGLKSSETEFAATDCQLWCSYTYKSHLYL